MISTEVFGFGLRLCVHFLAGGLVQTGQGLSHRSSENLDGFLARLHHSPQNEGKETEPISELGAKIAVNIICLGETPQGFL